MTKTVIIDGVEYIPIVKKSRLSIGESVIVSNIITDYEVGFRGPIYVGDVIYWITQKD